MNIQVLPTKLQDVKLIVPAIVRDHRGFFIEVYNRKALQEAAGIDVDFVQDNHSQSVKRGVIRGLHFQSEPFAQDKLVRVVRGAIFDVAVDIRVGSPSFGQHVSALLSADNKHQMWIPKGFAHGLCTLEPETEVIYKVSAYYDKASDRGLAWDDPQLGIDWPIAPQEAILSDKDRLQPRLAELPPYFRY